MALQAELLSVLDNSDEPLSKRLRIATDVFNANDLPAFNKESVLFNWFGNICLKTDTIDVWNTLLECITSSHMKDMSSNIIQHNVLSAVVKAIIKQLKKGQDKNIKNNVTQCGIAVVNNSMFQQYFKHDLKQYCKLISELFENVEDVNIVKEIMNSNLLFTEKNFDKTEYVSNFLSITLNALIKVLLKFQDLSLQIVAQKLIYSVLITSNSNDFLNFITTVFEQSDELSSNIIFEQLKLLYSCETQIAKHGFKIIFVTLLSVCRTEIMQYRLFILFLNAIGFKIKKIKLNLPKFEEGFYLEKSLEILSEIFDILCIKNITIKESINEISFSNFLKSLVTSIIRLQTQPNISTLTILKSMISIDPLIIENLLDEVIALIALFKKDDNMHFVYSDLMISIMKMYFKLRRVGKFYSVLSETLHRKLCSKFKLSKPEIKFSGETSSNVTLGVACDVKDVLPENVLQYFQECITLHSSKDVAMILRTCIFNMKQVTDDFHSYSDDHKVFFVQIMSELICNILSSVKLGDTTANFSLKKIADELNTLREELRKFGTTLLTVEHNHLLMFSFLNICYTWAEVAMIITFYTNIDNLNFKGEIENDTSVNNLIYLHNYLSAEQWSLVVQRIKNFGEQPCKYVLQKLLIQKLRAVMIFESEVNKNVESSIIANYATNLETSWDIILSERFIVAYFIPKMETIQLTTLAELLMDHMINKNNFEFLKQRIIIDSRDLMTSMFYVALSKICDLFKRKRKHSDSVNIKPICTKIFKNMDANSFIKSEVVDVKKIAENFNGEFNEIKNFKINEDSFCTYMEIIKYIPVTSLSHDLQVTLFLYLLSICSDLRNSRTQNIKCLQKCEEYLIALVENHLSSPNLFSYLESDIFVTYILESVQKYNVLIFHVIRKGLSLNDTIPSCKAIIHLLEKNISNEKYLETVFSSLQVINKASLTNVLEENKTILQKYKDKLLKTLLTFIVSNETVTENKIIAFALLLEKYLVDDTDDTLAKLIPLLNKHIDFAVNNIDDNNAEEFLSFFKSVLSNKSAITSLPENFNKSVWKACKNLKNMEKYKSFNNILTLLFQDASNDDFSIILQELLDINLNYIKTNDISNIQLKILKNLLNSDLSDEKNHIVKNMVQILFANLTVLLENNTNQEFNTEFTNFQIDMIKHVKDVLSPTFMDVHFQTTQIIISKACTTVEFICAFDSSFTILESLVNFRKELLIDRLPTFLLHFRLYLHKLCVHSNSDVNLNSVEHMKIVDCAFRIEKLTRNICAMKQNIFKIAPYLIADFLKEYEKIALYPDVKYHLDNCLMELVEICDKHAISYLLRVLSPASTELFKEVHNIYNKFYKFTGKV